MSNLAEIGETLGIPGVTAPGQKGGVVNHGNEGYKKRLDDDMRMFMADIDTDNVEIVEMQDVREREGRDGRDVRKSVKMDEEDRLLE